LERSAKLGEDRATQSIYCVGREWKFVLSEICGKMVSAGMVSICPTAEATNANGGREARRGPADAETGWMLSPDSASLIRAILVSSLRKIGLPRVLFWRRNSPPA